MERRSAPIMTLSLADSKSTMPTMRLPTRAASRAASLTMLARSAPENPGVPRAITLGSTSGPTRTFFMWTWRIFSRPRTSGLGTTTWRSKRPGRSSAGSSTSGRLVAAIRITPSLASKPSISTKSWFRVCSRSSLPPPRPAAAVPADRIDLIDEHDAGRVLLGLLEHVAHARGADADEHLDEIGARDGEERHVGLAGDRSGEQGLAGAGRADQQHALGDAAADLLELLRVPQELDDLLQLLLGLVDAGDVVEGDPAVLLGQQARPRLAEAHRFAAARLHLAHEEDPHPDQQQHREPRHQDAEQGRHALVDRRCGDAHAALGQPADQLRVLGRVGAEGAAVGEMTADRVALNGDVAHPPVVDLGDEVGERQIGLRPAPRGVLEQVEERDQQQADDDPERQVLGKVVHPAASPRWSLVTGARSRSGRGGIRAIHPITLT